MAAFSPSSLNSPGDLLAILQEGQIRGQTAQWLKSHLVLLGPQTVSNANEREEDDRIPTLYASDCAPSLRNFMIVAWNRLFRYPHAVKHVNGVIHGLHASCKSANFELCLREALQLFGAPPELAEAVWAAREGMRWMLESTWRSHSREVEFHHRTEAISSVQLQFDRRGTIVGAKFRLHWLNDCSYLVDPFEENSPTFALIHHFIAWIKNSDRELDAKIVGRNLKHFVTNLDTEAGAEMLFRDVIKALQHFASQEQFKEFLQVLSSLVQLQRVRASRDQEGNISLFNPDNLSIFAALLGIDTKELRYQLFTDTSKAKLGFHGTKDFEQVNQDLLRIAVVLYRSLVTWLFDRINERLRAEDFHAVIELFDIPGVTIQQEDTCGSYDTFCRNVVNDVMTFSAFEKRNEDKKKILVREGISLDLERPPYDDYLAFYFTQGKNDCLLSMLSQEKTKKDHTQRLKKQIFATFKTNQRVIKMKTGAKGSKETIVGITHASEDTVHYQLEKLHEACSAVVPSGLTSAIGESRHPVARHLHDYRNNAVGLAYTRGALMALSEKLVSEKSFWIYCLPVHKRGDLIERRHVLGLHLFNQCLRQMSDFSEVIDHRTIFENYTHVFFKRSDGLQPSPETSRRTLEKLQIFGYISARNVFLCETDFYNLEIRLRNYRACVFNSQRFARGFLARRKLENLKQEATSYRTRLMTDFGGLRKACDRFCSVQHDHTTYITEVADAELLKKLMHRSENVRKQNKTAWGFCFVLRFGKQVTGFPLHHDLYWIFAKPAGQVDMEKNFVNLCSYPTLTADDDALCETFCDGFYFRKSSNNSLSVKRKTIEPMSLWGATKSFRGTVAPGLRENEGILPFKQFAYVFDNELFKATIANSLHTKNVSSRAIEGESVIPLIVGSLEKYSTLTEAPYCFVIVDLSIKDSLCLDAFNKEIREEVKRLKKLETEGDPKWGGRKGRKGRDADIWAGSSSIHSLLIKMDRSLTFAGSDEKLSEVLGRSRKKEKWSRKGYEKRKMTDRLM